MLTVGKTDLVAAVARGPAELYRDICGLRIYDPPTGKIPVTISLVRHQRAARDPALNWVWERIATLAEL
jgi:DNA-binding transcriptional LysR family regulator